MYVELLPVMGTSVGADLVLVKRNKRVSAGAACAVRKIKSESKLSNNSRRHSTAQSSARHTLRSFEKTVVNCWSSSSICRFLQRCACIVVLSIFAGSLWPLINRRLCLTADSLSRASRNWPLRTRRACAHVGLIQKLRLQTIKLHCVQEQQPISTLCQPPSAAATIRVQGMPALA